MILKGKNVCRETIMNGKGVKKITIKESFNDSVLAFMKKKNIHYNVMDDLKFQKLYPDAQGICVEVEDYKYKSLDECLEKVDDDSLCLILDSVMDPQNFGNIIRSFEALGGSFIMIPKNRSIEVNETVCKVSCGAYSYVDICQVTNLNQAIKKLKDKGYFVLGTDMHGETDYDMIRVDMPIAFVIGNEGSGMSKLVRENCDTLLRIPMKGKINSLNASVSGAIILSDIQSRRRRK